MIFFDIADTTIPNLCLKNEMLTC